MIDYTKSIDNYKKYIYKYFNNLGYDIDVFLCTNDIDNDEIKNNIIQHYNPIKYLFVNNLANKTKSRNTKLKYAVELCKNSKIKYDLVLITRFDLIFNKNFDEINIDFTKINIVSLLEKPNLICDNFYLLPFTQLNMFYKLINKNINNSFHLIKKDLERINKINFMLNENVLVENLNFYKIVRTIK